MVLSLLPSVTFWTWKITLQGKAGGEGGECITLEKESF